MASAEDAYDLLRDLLADILPVLVISALSQGRQRPHLDWVLHAAEIWGVGFSIRRSTFPCAVCGMRSSKPTSPLSAHTETETAFRLACMLGLANTAEGLRRDLYQAAPELPEVAAVAYLRLGEMGISEQKYVGLFRTVYGCAPHERTPPPGYCPRCGGEQRALVVAPYLFPWGFSPEVGVVRDAPPAAAPVEVRDAVLDLDARPKARLNTDIRAGWGRIPMGTRVVVDGRHDEVFARVIWRGHPRLVHHTALEWDAHGYPPP